MSRFTAGIADAAERSPAGLHFGTAADLRFASWRDIHQTGARVAGRLAAGGVVRGSRVAVLAANAEDVAPVVQGIWRVGAAMTMLQQPTPRADLTEWRAGTLRVLSMLDASCVVVGQPFFAVADALRACGYQVIEIPQTWPDDEAVAVPTYDDDVALYQLTSGSTGRPQGVAITHRNLRSDIDAMAVRWEIDSVADAMMSWLPLSHDMGLVICLLLPMCCGMKVVYVPPAEFVKSPPNWVQIMSDQRVTMTSAPNFAYSIINRRIKAVEDGAYDLDALRKAVCGGEPIDPATMQEFTRQAGRFGMRNTALIAAYGLAEATVVVSSARVDRPLRIDTVCAEGLKKRRRAVPARDVESPQKDFVTVGRPCPGIEVRIVSPARVTLPARHVGEIAIRGDVVARRYLTPDGEIPAVDKDGWLYTGDLGYLTDDGEIVVCGRQKNVIIIAGRNIFPAEIERLAESADGIRRGGVVAFGVELPDRREEMRIVAETVEDYPSDVSRQIRRQVAQSVLKATGVSPTVLLVDKGSIPKTLSGKIRHVAAKEIFAKTAGSPS
jgi:fatty-acyl-CoA synthase